MVKRVTRANKRSKEILLNNLSFLHAVTLAVCVLCTEDGPNLIVGPLESGRIFDSPLRFTSIIV